MQLVICSGVEFKVFRTLIVTTSEARLQGMRETVSLLPFSHAHAKRFLWGTTAVSASRVFEPIWQALDVSDGRVYAIG